VDSLCGGTARLRSDQLLAAVVEVLVDVRLAPSGVTEFDDRTSAPLDVRLLFNRTEDSDPAGPPRNRVKTPVVRDLARPSITRTVRRHRPSTFEPAGPLSPGRRASIAISSERHPGKVSSASCATGTLAAGDRRTRSRRCHRAPAAALPSFLHNRSERAVLRQSAHRPGPDAHCTCRAE